MRSPRPSSLLAARVVVQPYGIWHRPWVRAGAMAAVFTLGMLVASRLLVPDAAGLDAENAALKEELAAARRTLEAERLRAAELERAVQLAGREAQRQRDEASAAQQKAAKRRERAPGTSESAAVVPPPAASAPPASIAEAPAAPRAE